MRKPVKIEKTHSSHGSTQMIRPPPESSPSEDSDSSSATSHVGPPRMTLSERYDLVINVYKITRLSILHLKRYKIIL